MKKIALIILIMMMILPASAKVTFGVRGGIGYSSMIQKIDETYRSGGRFAYNVGGLMDVPLYKSWSLRPELSFASQGGTFYSNEETSGLPFKYNSCTYYSIRIPVNLAYTFTFSDMRLGVFAGPALDYSLTGKIKTEEGRRSLQFGQVAGKDLKAFDLGVSIGLMADYKNVFFSINAICGTLDRRSIRHAGESAIYQNNVTFSLGYFFRTR